MPAKRTKEATEGGELGNWVDLFVEMVARQLLGPAYTVWTVKGSRTRAFAERSTTPPAVAPCTIYA